MKYDIECKSEWQNIQYWLIFFLCLSFIVDVEVDVDVEIDVDAVVIFGTISSTTNQFYW